MALIRWEPARELDSLQTEMNRLFSSFFEPGGTTGAAAGARRWVPSMDMVETDEHFALKVDLPGLRQEDIAIEFEGDTLSISGERSERHDRKEGGFVRLERASGAFRRTLTLPKGVDPDAVQASYAAGVLEVLIPKPEERKARRVQINVGDGQSLIEA